MKAVDPFYTSKRWRDIRIKVIRRDKYKCQQCGVLCLGKAKGKPSPEVDHIQERKTHPQLAYNMGNLQVLCRSCHSKKTINTMHSQGKPLIGADGYVVQEGVVQAGTAC